MTRRVRVTTHDDMTHPVTDEPILPVRTPDPLDLDAVEALCDAATPGPWSCSPTSNGGELLKRGRDMLPDRHPQSSIQIVPKADAAFIAAARTLVPALVTRLRAAEAENARLRVDAERLDWIEAALKDHGAVWFLPCGDDMRFVQVRSFGDVENFRTVTGTCRDAIDAARTPDGAP